MPTKKLTKSELISKVAELQNIINTYQHEQDETNSSTLQNNAEIKDGAISGWNFSNNDQYYGSIKLP